MSKGQLTVRSIKGYIKKLKLLIDKVSEEEGLGKLYLYTGFFVNYLIFGCSITEYITYRFYALNCHAKREFITNRKQKKVAYRFNPKNEAEAFDNKYLFNKIFKDFIKRKWLYTEASTQEDIRLFIEEQGEVILKPVDQACGVGIKKISYADLTGDPEILQNLTEDKFVLEEIISNHEDIKVLNPGTLNTVRMVTLVRRDGSAKVLKAFIRMGSGNNVVDNFHAGGIAAQIDIETGIIISKGKSIYHKDILKHPYSQIVLLGRQIPLWEEAKEFAKNLAMVKPECRYIGWDIAITDNGIEVIEGNYVAGITALQFIDGKGMYKVLKREV